MFHRKRLGIKFKKMLDTEFLRHKIPQRLAHLNAHSVNSIRKVLPLIVVNRSNGVKRFKMTRQTNFSVAVVISLSARTNANMRKALHDTQSI
jgi:hypothetical protein